MVQRTARILDTFTFAGAALLLQKNTQLHARPSQGSVDEDRLRELSAAVTDGGVTYTIQYDVFTVGAGFLDLQAFHRCSSREFPRYLARRDVRFFLGKQRTFGEAMYLQVASQRFGEAATTTPLNPSRK